MHVSARLDISCGVLAMPLEAFCFAGVKPAQTYAHFKKPFTQLSVLNNGSRLMGGSVLITCFDFADKELYVEDDSGLGGAPGLRRQWGQTFYGCRQE